MLFVVGSLLIYFIVKPILYINDDFSIVKQTMRNFPQKPINFSEMEARFLATITALCTEKTPFESGNFLPELEAIRRRISLGEQLNLASLLWSAYHQLVEAAQTGIFTVNM